MANARITELDPLLTATGADFFVIVDNSSGETKKIAISDFLGSPGPIGSNVADSGVFITLELQSGTVVNTISQNPSLGTSNSALATQGSIKEYIDSQLNNKQTTYRISTDTTAIAYDIMLVNTISGNVNLVLSDELDGTIIVKKISSDSNLIIITTSSGNTIDSQNQIIISTQYQSYSIVVDDGDFFII